MNLLDTLADPLLMRPTTVCAWHPEYFGKNLVIQQGTPGAPTSHSICDRCCAILMQESAV